jgi:Sporulation and spore germination
MRVAPEIPRHLLISVAVLLIAAALMSSYAWHMRKLVTATEIITTDTRPLAPPVAGPTERVALFVAHDDDGTLHAQAAEIPMPSGRQERTQELLRALLAIYLDKNSPHVLGSGADVRSVFLVDPGVAVIDVNSAFADTHRSGVLVEELTIASFIHTISVNTPGIVKVRILVDGKERDTLAGHADLSSFYDVNAVSQLVSQLQSGQ